MQFELNNTPHLSMAEITIKLFNRKFLSDVRFLVDNKVIYAHSLELMKRSVVFQNQLIPTLGDTKLILINDVMYDSVYQFVRFIYCDECEICDANAIDLFKLAQRYRVIKLQNKLFESIRDCGLLLKLFEYSLLANDQLYLQHYRETLNDNLIKALDSKQLLTVDRAVIEVILKFDRVNVPEYKLFSVLVRWIERDAQINRILKSEYRKYYTNLIDLVRFPVMTNKEIIKCTADFPHLFSDYDRGHLFNIITKQFDDNNSPWNIQKRLPFNDGRVWILYNQDENFDTTFTVTREMYLCGLRIGNASGYRLFDYEVTITQRDRITNHEDTLKFKCVESPKGDTSVINCGASIRVLPNKLISIGVKYLVGWIHRLDSGLSVYLRNKSSPIYINFGEDLISIKKCSRNLLQLHFQLIN